MCESRKTRSDVPHVLGIKRMFLSLCDVPLWLHYTTGILSSWVYVNLIVPSFPWLVSRICCTVMDVLTVQYCGLIKLPVFRLVFFFPFLYRVRCTVIYLKKLCIDILA